MEKIVVSSYHTLVFYFKDGNVTTQEWKSTALKDMWTDEQKKKQRQWMEMYHQNDTSGRYTAFRNALYVLRARQNLSVV